MRGRAVESFELVIARLLLMWSSRRRTVNLTPSTVNVPLKFTKLSQQADLIHWIYSKIANSRPPTLEFPDHTRLLDSATIKILSSTISPLNVLCTNCCALMCFPGNQQRRVEFLMTQRVCIRIAEHGETLIFQLWRFNVRNHKNFPSHYPLSFARKTRSSLFVADTFGR
jgi:hypothetical protein